MYLKRCIAVNWGNLPQQEFEFGPINLFSGGNGSGKTTAADALQTLMTAAHDNLFTYNPGQDETTQKGRGGKQVRTLASYVLGCDDGAYARPWDCDGYLAAVFAPTRGESAEPFTVVLAVRAHLDRAGPTAQARLDELQFLVLSGTMLSLSHFVRDYPDGRHVVPLTELGALLKQEFGAGQVETYDKKRAYLRRLYGALRGRRDAVSDREAMHAARSFASFMAYKPVRSISEFVAGEVLDKKELGDTIRKVRDLLRTVHGMEEEARALAESVTVLERGRSAADRYSEHWLAHAAAGYGAAQQSLRDNQRHYLNSKQAQESLRARLAEFEQEQRRNDDQLNQTHRGLVQLEARRQGVAALKTKDDLEQQREQLSRSLADAAQPLLHQDQQLDSNLAATQSIIDALRQSSIGQVVPELESNGWREDSRALLALRDQPRPDLHQLLGRDWIDLSPLENALDTAQELERVHNRLSRRLHHSDQGNGSLCDRLSRLVDEHARNLERYRERIQQAESAIRILENHRVSYPRHVEETLNAIRQQCPQADPRVLCDYIDVMEPEWQMAIEGYIGGARFSLLVEPDYEAEAIRIVRSPGGRTRNRARVIQGEKARRDAERLSLPQGSIIEVMRFEHKIAEHYLRASYGNVIRVNDAETLRTTPRGITQGGLGSGNYSMWRCDLDDSELVFGQGARQRALAAHQQQLQTLLAEAEDANAEYQAAHRVLQQIERIQPVQYIAAVESMLNSQRQLRDVENQLAGLDLSEHEALEQELAEQQRLYDQLRDKQRQLAEQHGASNNELQQKDQEIERLAARQDGLEENAEQAEHFFRQGSGHHPDSNPEALLADIDRRLDAASADIDFSAEQNQHSQKLNQLAMELERAVLEHNQRARSGDAVIYDTGHSELHSLEFFRQLNALRSQLDNLHNRLRNNVLLEKREQLSGLRETFNTAFVSNLCHEIYQAIEDGRRTLDSLNDELQHHCFGADRERFEFQYDWLPEFKEYWDFFKEVINLPSLGDGVTLFDAELSKRSQTMRDKLLSVLLDGDEQQALRELERISDYRNYRRYDILKHPQGKPAIPLSQYGTGSGGQLETPAYIIRAAAVTSAFRFNEGDTHLRMVIVDEAFMHMDEVRSREVIRYLTETLGLQLIFIMPTSKSGPFMDLISNQFVFSKVPCPQPVGELNTRVLVDRQVLNQDRIAELWDNHRRTIRHQALLDFMEEV